MPAPDLYVALPGNVNGAGSLGKPVPVEASPGPVAALSRYLASLAAVLWLLMLVYDTVLALDMCVERACARPRPRALLRLTRAATTLPALHTTVHWAATCCTWSLLWLTV